MYPNQQFSKLISDLKAVHVLAENSSECHPMMRSWASTRLESHSELSWLYKYAQAGAIAAALIKGSDSSFTRVAASCRIPLITHHIWICSDYNPQRPKSEFLNRALESRLAFSEDYCHYFWLPRSLIRQDTGLIDYMNSFGFEVRAIEDIFTERYSSARRAYYAFLRDSKYAFASDIARILVLASSGGIYMDLGVILTINPLQSGAFADASYMFIYWKNMFFQNSLMAMEIESNLAMAYLDQFNNDSCAYAMRALVGDLTGQSEGFLLGGPGLTKIYLERILWCENSKTILLPANMNAVSWMAQQSWYVKDSNGKSPYGNCYIPDSSPSYFVN